MITKERLEELIEQGATIWHWEYGKLRERELNKSYHINIFMNKEWLCKSYCDFDDDVRITHIAPFFEVFETKGEAEWHKEFSCIERTERLELPTWEEDVRKDILFSASGGIRYIFMKKIKTGYSIEKENPYIIRIQKIGEHDNFIDYEYTKENYTLACRKCKELFLGERNV